MKKLLFTFVLILSVTLSANAQRYIRRPHRAPRIHRIAQPAPKPHPRPSIPYFDNIGDLRLHFNGELGFYDISGIFVHELPQHYSIGAMAELQTGRFLSLGLGAEFYGIRHINNSEFSNWAYLNCVPVYGNVRLSTNGRCRLFAEVRAGYAIPTNQVYTSNSGKTVAAQGFYTGAGIGLGFYDNSISVGFNSIDISNTNSSQPVLHSGTNGQAMATDFYIRYSYAIPLN